MGAAHLAASNVYRGGHDTLHTQHVHQQADPRHVGHRVQSPHLVEVHVSHGAAVGLGFRLGDGVVHPSGVGLHLLRQGELSMTAPMWPGVAW